MRKAEIVKLGLELNAPFDLTWSCYQREDRACGVCDSCTLRLHAFRDAGAEDPILYAEARRPIDVGPFRSSAIKLEVKPGG